MKRTMLLGPLLLIASFATWSLAQDTDPQSSKKPESVRFAECNNCPEAGLKQILKSFYEKVRDGDGLAGYVILYGSPREMERLKQRILRNLTFRDPYDPPRVTFVYAPTKGKGRADFWIVPQGAAKPNPTP